MVTWLSGEPAVPQSYLGVHGVNLMVVNPLGAEPIVNRMTSMCEVSKIKHRSINR